MIRSVHKRRSRAGRRDLLQQATCAHARRGPGVVTGWSTRTGSGRAHKLTYPTSTASAAIAPTASCWGRPSARCQPIDERNLAPRPRSPIFFREISSTPWPFEKPIGLPHVPRRRPCGNRFGFRSRWTDNARDRKKRATRESETKRVAPALAGLQLDGAHRPSAGRARDIREMTDV